MTRGCCHHLKALGWCGVAESVCVYPLQTRHTHFHISISILSTPACTRMRTGIYACKDICIHLPLYAFICMHTPTKTSTVHEMHTQSYAQTLIHIPDECIACVIQHACMRALTKPPSLSNTCTRTRTRACTHAHAQRDHHSCSNTSEDCLFSDRNNPTDDAH